VTGKALDREQVKYLCSCRFVQYRCFVSSNLHILSKLGFFYVTQLLIIIEKIIFLSLYFLWGRACLTRLTWKIVQDGDKLEKSRMLGKFPEARKLWEFTGNSVQFQRQILINKIVSLDVVSRVKNGPKYICGWGSSPGPAEGAYRVPRLPSLQLLFCDNLWICKLMALGKPRKLKEFFFSVLSPPEQFLYDLGLLFRRSAILKGTILTSSDTNANLNPNPA